MKKNNAKNTIKSLYPRKHAFTKTQKEANAINL